MAINIKYSYNGYDPSSPVIIAQKEALINQRKKGVIKYKEYSAACSAMKRGFKRQSFIGISADEFNNTEIIGSSFMQEIPYTDVFPANIVNVIFDDCNLDNCNIPKGTTLINCKHRQYKVQNDKEYWLVDKSLNPVVPLKPNRFDVSGISKNPNDIPTVELKDPITETNDPTRIEQRKIEELASDREKLKEILMEKGEL